MSEYNTKPIDIVIPWVNPNDDNWFNQYSYWKEKCTGMKSPERIRDFGNFKYWFRSVEACLPWIRFIYLVIPYKSSIPKWLKYNHPKIKIVTQEEYLPAKYNPTFNSYICTMYLHKLPGLSENFIYSNDDFIFCKKQNENDYFINDFPVRTIKYEPGITTGNTMFNHNVRNDEDLIANELTDIHYKFKTWHTNFVFKKSFIEFMWNKFGDKFEQSFVDSKFRQNYNLTDLVFDYAQQVCNICINKPVCLNTHYFGLRNNSTKSEMLACMNIYSVVCFNDNEYVVGDTTKLCKNLTDALNTMYPRECAYEI